MLMLKSAHEALIKAKDAQIAALEDQVRFLRSIIQPNNPRAIVIQEEADLVIEGRQTQVEVERTADIESEASRLLAGHY